MPLSLDAALQGLAEDVHRIGQGTTGLRPSIVGVEEIGAGMIGDASGFLVVVDYGGEQTVGVPVCVRGEIPIEEFKSYLGGPARVLH